MRVHLVAADVASWREWSTGSGVGNWSVYEADSPERGDVVVGVLVAAHSPALIMDLSTDTEWSSRRELVADDWIEVQFPLRLKVVWDQAGVRPRRPPALLQGTDGDSFYRALLALRSEPQKAREGRNASGQRRQRSRANREYLLARHTGVCPCCERDYSTELSGGRGYAALEVHHLNRVSARPDVEFDTALDELSVLCASCHILASAASTDPEVDMHPDALRQMIRPGSKPRCIRCGHAGNKRSRDGLACTRCPAKWRPQLKPAL